MAIKFLSITKLVLLFAVTLLLVQASARNLQQTQDMPIHRATAPTKADSPTANAHLDDQKNFIYGAGIGGAAGIGGFMGMPGGGGTGMTLPLPTGTPLLGGAGMGGIGGIGGAMGLPGGIGGAMGLPGGLGGDVPSSSSGLVTP